MRSTIRGVLKPDARNFDVVVVGAGSSGATAAYHLSQKGWKVALLDIRSFENAGASWVNTIAPEMFDRAQIPRPFPPETIGEDRSFVVLNKAGNHQIEINPSPVWSVNMGLLVRRLQNLALRAGAIPFERTSPLRLDFTGKRLTAIHAIKRGENGRSEEFLLHSKLFVDATGVSGVLRNRVPNLSAYCPVPNAQDLCAADQQLHRIKNLAGASSFLKRYGRVTGDILNFIGVAGGYSTLTIHVDLEHKHVGILTGKSPALHLDEATSMIDEFIGQESWVGNLIYGGKQMIPIRQPYEKQYEPGLALVGDAGCHVFPAHGSGVGTGMIASTILAQATKNQKDPGSVEALDIYQTHFLTEIGAVCAAYDVFRKALQRLSSKDMDNLLAAGLVTRTMARAGMAQKMPLPSPLDIIRLAQAFPKGPSRAVKLSGVALQMTHAYTFTKIRALTKRMTRSVVPRFFKEYK